MIRQEWNRENRPSRVELGLRERSLILTYGFMFSLLDCLREVYSNVHCTGTSEIVVIPLMR